MQTRSRSKSVRKKSARGMKCKPTKRTRATDTPAMNALLSATAPEPLVTAKIAHERIGLERRAIYDMAKRRLIPSYRTGAKGGGVRFRISEVIAAIRRPAMAEHEQAAAKTGNEKER